MKERPALTRRETEQNQSTKSEDNRPRGGKKREKEGKGELALVVGSNKKRGTFPKTWYLEDIHESPRKCRDSDDSHMPAGE